MEEEGGAMELDEDAPLALALKRKRKTTPKTKKEPNVIPKKKESRAPPNKPPEAAHDPQPAQLPASAEDHTTGASPEILVSEFDYSVENHLTAVDTIAKLCGHPTTLDANHAEIKRISNSITFLREWRDFKYAPRTVRFACQHNSKEKDVTGGVTLSQFSAASVPKKEAQNESEAGTESSKDFVMHVGGSIWALDWCPSVDCNSENPIKSQFVAVAAHPPESSYHKIGAPLTGRGAIQIWCFLTASVKEDGKKRPRRNSQKSNDLAKLPRPRGRPRKKPLNDSIEKMDTDNQCMLPPATEYPMSSPRSRTSGRTSRNASKHSYGEECIRTYTDSNQMEHANAPLFTAPKGRINKAKAGKEDQVQNNNLHILRQCEQGESATVNPLASASLGLDSMSAEKNITCINTCDANTCQNFVSKDVALPRMMLCLAHNGKVAWDVKWRPVNARNPESMHIMGYLAVLLGNGALEVWEVPHPHTVKLAYPACQERIDPRFIKLKPVFRCSKLKCGDRQSIPLTLEWSTASPHDMILAGCHDGVVALWKFSITDSLTETRPLLSFSAETGPIRTLAWAPIQSDLESANVIVTAGHKGFKFWDIRDPFRPLWDHAIPAGTYGLDWLPDPRCVFGSLDDGTLWLLNLERTAHDIPVAGKSHAVASKHGFHCFYCSSFSICSVQASRLTGMVAYCGEEGTTLCFQPTARSVRDPSRNRVRHYLCGSLLEEEPALIVASPSAKFLERSPNLKRSGAPKGQMVICSGSDPVDKRGSNDSSQLTKKQAPKSKKSSKSEVQGDEGEGTSKGEEIEVFPPKNVAMNRVRWNVNKGSENWLCYGGAAGLLRCQEVDFF